MEQKKSKEVNLERKRGAFFFVGLVMTTAMVGMAFEYESFTAEEEAIVFQENRLDDEIIFDIPEQEEEIPEEEPVQETPPPVIEEILVVDEEVEEIDLGMIEMEVDPDDYEEEEEEEIQEEDVLTFVEQDASFPGGEGAMAQWINKHIEYPQLAAEMGQEGKVMVEFVVNKDGSIEQIKIAQSASGALDAEAKRLVKKMPKWIPGEHMGKTVRSRFYLPIHFLLR